MTAAQLLEELDDGRYLALEIELRPVGFPTIQPTTFANTGPSFYEAPEGGLAAVVDSVASMANQLELTIWDESACEPKPPVASLPWVKVVDANGEYYTSSRVAAHRLNAHSLINGIVNGGVGAKKFEDFMKELLPENATPPVNRRLGQVIWEHDPLSIVHGCWLPGIWKGRARLSRALTARIDALAVQSQGAQVGGQKTADSIAEVEVRHVPGQQEKTVEGERPYYTSEVSAARIVSPIVLDLVLLRSYGLAESAYQALVATAVLQITELVAAWPRRRSRCILEPKEVLVQAPDGWMLPNLDDLREECRRRCEAATGVEFAEPLVLRYTPKAKS